MRDLIETALGRGTRRWSAPAAALVAASLLVASAAPVAAFGPTTVRPYSTHDYSAAGSHHHSYRGVTEKAPAAESWSADASTMVADEMDPSTAYCSDRFRSYDPSTGTYLGYDGREHACP